MKSCLPSSSRKSNNNWWSVWLLHPSLVKVDNKPLENRCPAAASTHEVNSVICDPRHLNPPWKRREPVLTVKEDTDQKSSSQHPARWHCRLSEGGCDTSQRLSAAQCAASCLIQLRRCRCALTHRSDGRQAAQSCPNWTVHTAGSVQVLAILVVPLILQFQEDRS